MSEEAYNRHGFSIELNSELPQGCVDDGGLVSHDFDEKFVVFDNRGSRKQQWWHAPQRDCVCACCSLCAKSKNSLCVCVQQKLCTCIIQ